MLGHHAGGNERESRQRRRESVDGSINNIKISYHVFDDQLKDSITACAVKLTVGCRTCELDSCEAVRSPCKDKFIQPASSRI